MWRLPVFAAILSPFFRLFPYIYSAMTKHYLNRSVTACCAWIMADNAGFLGWYRIVVSHTACDGIKKK